MVYWFVNFVLDVVVFDVFVLVYVLVDGLLFVGYEDFLIDVDMVDVV